MDFKGASYCAAVKWSAIKWLIIVDKVLKSKH